jgi:DNA processing protein
LAAGGETVAVLGCGIDVCYPWANRDLYDAIAQRGTLLSEYELGTRALRHNFPTRNRIIAGMSLGVVIVEGRIGGGAMITARLAMEFGREVFAVAGPVHAHQSQGPHSLVRDGARLVTSASDIIEDLGLESPLAQGSRNQTPLGLTPDERAILAALEASPTLLDIVAKGARMPPSAASATLARLELKGLVARHPGARFALSASGTRSPHH